MITERVSGGSLFERIGEATKPSSRQRPKAALLHSVRDNLRNILNTRSDSCYGSPELGIADFNDESPDRQNIREWIVQAIQNCILRYEPRISDVAVTAATEDSHAPLELRFHIVAYLHFSDRQDVLEFDVMLENRQHWCVE
ncbi:type VI secretion system baseplate subunit TssE [Citrobacter amalonaticus]|uniref:Gene 25-like lysozyme n=1 Tax=Citrobacter amalonaticus TaxID=35703 RepID=A0A6N2X8U5_CITAM|nr:MULTISPECIES: type VI secretion system baseplate subunit TssE [Citrobacter]AUZ63333.1 type VI secretion system baseplate subunit TssE [Citrobacter sp. CFNIH10]EKW5092755.1 type VI secretion system baseplate subunit TssE [Citrobacter amalonaticus]KEY51945.1 type VI secretion protein [Citrobacter amalonaticus]MBJ9077604.1 type VI secretion system baseplate subunit TssE [Citrobacter amalonaticus]MBJ9317928.1 type VI secretion system baseplate subunit TssE [Citrobacter amalonaticus]